MLPPDPPPASPDAAPPAADAAPSAADAAPPAADAAPHAALEAALDAALGARSLPGPDDHAALRLFSGFYEGYPSLSLDLYGRTLVLHDHGASPDGDEPAARAALARVTARLPWLGAALWKIRKGRSPDDRNGRLLLGAEADLDDRILEDGVWYALDLRLNRDTSFYLDTRPLRAWARASLAGKSVLNAFAYTGSLGVAALAGGARRVVHVDRNPAFLEVAKRSCALNKLPVQRGDFMPADFFVQVGRFKREQRLFDAIFVDPPFFSSTEHGKVDLVDEAHRVLNKVRPLIGHGGHLIAVNNALYLSGADYHAMLQRLCSDGYLSLAQLLPVPDDVAGPPTTRRGTPPTDPSPFNHPTKIAILAVTRKDGRRAG